MNGITKQTRRQSYDGIRTRSGERCKLILETLGNRSMTVEEITDEVRENYTQCLVDEAYDDLSPAGREAIANLSDDAAISNPDRVTISKASTACRKHVGELIIPGS